MSSLLFDVPDYHDRATRAMGGASRTASQARPGSTTETEAPAKTAGGAIMSGMGAAGAGAAVGAGLTTAEMTAAGASFGPPGAIIGAVVGLGAYFLS